MTDDTLAALKTQYKQQLVALRAIFPSWSDDDFVNTLDDALGDIELATSRILEGHATQWTHTKSRKKPITKSTGGSNNALNGTSAQSHQQMQPGEFRGGERGRGRGGARGGRGSGGARGHGRGEYDSSRPPRSNKYDGQRNQNSVKQPVADSTITSNADFNSDTNISWGAVTVFDSTPMADYNSVENGKPSLESKITNQDSTGGEQSGNNWSEVASWDTPTTSIVGTNTHDNSKGRLPSPHKKSKATPTPSSSTTNNNTGASSKVSSQDKTASVTKEANAKPGWNQLTGNQSSTTSEPAVSASKSRSSWAQIAKGPTAPPKAPVTQTPTITKSSSPNRSTSPGDLANDTYNKLSNEVTTQSRGRSTSPKRLETLSTDATRATSPISKQSSPERASSPSPVNRVRERSSSPSKQEVQSQSQINASRSQSLKRSPERSSSPSNKGVNTTVMPPGLSFKARSVSPQITSGKNNIIRHTAPVVMPSNIGLSNVGVRFGSLDIGGDDDDLNDDIKPMSPTKSTNNNTAAHNTLGTASTTRHSNSYQQSAMGTANVLITGSGTAKTATTTPASSLHHQQPHLQGQVPQQQQQQASAVEMQMNPYAMYQANLASPGTFGVGPMSMAGDAYGLYGGLTPDATRAAFAMSYYDPSMFGQVRSDKYGGAEPVAATGSSAIAANTQATQQTSQQGFGSVPQNMPGYPYGFYPPYYMGQFNQYQNAYQAYMKQNMFPNVYNSSPAGANAPTSGTGNTGHKGASTAAYGGFQSQSAYEDAISAQQQQQSHTGSVGSGSASGTSSNSKQQQHQHQFQQQQQHHDYSNNLGSANLATMYGTATGGNASYPQQGGYLVNPSLFGLGSGASAGTNASSGASGLPNQLQSMSTTTGGQSGMGSSNLQSGGLSGTQGTSKSHGHGHGHGHHASQTHQLSGHGHAHGHAHPHGQQTGNVGAASELSNLGGGYGLSTQQGKQSMSTTPGYYNTQYGYQQQQQHHQQQQQYGYSSNRNQPYGGWSQS